MPWLSLRFLLCVGSISMERSYRASKKQHETGIPFIEPVPQGKYTLDGTDNLSKGHHR
jgi:hypothetical protein